MVLEAKCDGEKMQDFFIKFGTDRCNQEVPLKVFTSIDVNSKYSKAGLGIKMCQRKKCKTFFTNIGLGGCNQGVHIKLFTSIDVSSK